jgi:hypothetical protein
MLPSLVGGALIAIGSLLVIILKRSGQREPRPFWARVETIESMVSVVLVTMFAAGAALIVDTVSVGWVAFAAGLALAVAGTAVAILLTRRRPAQPAGIRAKTA